MINPFKRPQPQTTVIDASRVAEETLRAISRLRSWTIITEEEEKEYVLALVSKIRQQLHLDEENPNG